MNAMTPAVWSSMAMSWRVDIVILLCRGVSIAEACREVGVSRARYYRHVNADPVFEAQVRRARAGIESQLLSVIMQSQNWRASAWFLEKRDPRNWGSIKDRLRLERCTCGASKYIG